MRGLPLVHTLDAALIDDTLSVAHDYIVVRHAHALDQLGAGNCRGASTIADNFDIFE